MKILRYTVFPPYLLIRLMSLFLLTFSFCMGEVYCSSKETYKLLTNQENSFLVDVPGAWSSGHQRRYIVIFQPPDSSELEYRMVTVFCDLWNQPSATAAQRKELVREYKNFKHTEETTCLLLEAAGIISAYTLSPAARNCIGIGEDDGVVHEVPTLELLPAVVDALGCSTVKDDLTPPERDLAEQGSAVVIDGVPFNQFLVYARAVALRNKRNTQFWDKLIEKYGTTTKNPTQQQIALPLFVLKSKAVQAAS